MTDWRSLNHAYGCADDVPALLAELTPSLTAKAWHELWGRICHQRTVYPASFAALPELLSIAERWTPAVRLQPLCLAGAILASSDVCGGQRDELLGPVAWVVPRFRELCNESLGAAGLSRVDFVYLLQAGRSFEGDKFWGERLDQLASGEFSGACPLCGVDLYLVIGKYGFFTTADDWVVPTRGKPGVSAPREGIERRPIEPRTGELPNVGCWLFDRACAAHQDDVATWIKYVFGTSECPSCGDGFYVQDAIAAA